VAAALVHMALAVVMALLIQVEEAVAEIHEVAKT
jgi:hypothetical protein